MRSAKREPSGESDPKEPLRQSTAFLKALSARLLVGSMPLIRVKVQRHP